jgi:hypothetical protein
MALLNCATAEDGKMQNNVRASNRREDRSGMTTSYDLVDVKVGSHSEM